MNQNASLSERRSCSAFHSLSLTYKMSSSHAPLQDNWLVYPPVALLENSLNEEKFIFETRPPTAVWLLRCETSKKLLSEIKPT